MMYQTEVSNVGKGTVIMAKLTCVRILNKRHNLSPAHTRAISLANGHARLLVQLIAHAAFQCTR